MACNFVEGQAINCNDGIAGVQKIWVTEWANVTTFTETSGTITALTQAASTKFWLIDLTPWNAMFTQTETGGSNVPVSVVQKMTWTALKHTAKMRNWNKILMQNRLMVLIQDGNGTYQMMGVTRGAYATNVENTSGKAANEFTGATYTLEASEPNEALYVSSGVVTGLSVGA